MQDSAKSLIATSFAHFINDGGLYVFIALYPKLLPLPSESVLIGSLAGMQNLLTVAASPWVGRTADAKKNYAKLLGIGLSLQGAGILGFSFSGLFASGFNLFLLLMPFAAVAGIGSSFYHPLGASILSEKWHSHMLGRAMGINGAVGSIGRAVFPLIVVALAVYFGVSSIALLAVLAFVSTGLVFQSLGKMSFAGKQAKEASSRNSYPLGSILPKILALTVVSFLKGFFTVGVVDFIPVFLKNVSGFKYGLELGGVFTLVLAVAIFGQPIMGSLADKFGRRLILGVTLGGAGLAIIFLLNTSNVILQIASLAAFGFFGLTGFPMLLPLATSVVPKEATTMSNSIVWGIGNVGGGAVGPFVVGLLAAPAFFGSLNQPFFIAAVVSLASLVLIPFIPKPESQA